jgi:hypothetical protein
MPVCIEYIPLSCRSSAVTDAQLLPDRDNIPVSHASLNVQPPLGNATTSVSVHVVSCPLHVRRAIRRTAPVKNTPVPLSFVAPPHASCRHFTLPATCGISRCQQPPRCQPPATWLHVLHFLLDISLCSAGILFVSLRPLLPLPEGLTTLYLQRALCNVVTPAT